MIRRIILVAAVFAIGLSASQSFAQGASRQRTGPLVSIGLGGGIGSQGGGADIDEPSFAFDLKLGVGLTERVFVYSVSRTAAYNSYTSVDVFYVEDFYGLGVTYFLKPSAPTFYGLAALGRGTSLRMYSGDNEFAHGLGYQFGGGYEFIPGLSIEGTISSFTVDGIVDAADVDVRNILLTLNWTWY